MKKRLGVLFLSALLCFGGGVSAFANEPISASAYDSNLRFKDIITITYNFIIDGDEALYEANVLADSADKISIYLELQKKTSSGWTKVKSSSGSANERVFAYEDSKIVDTSEFYRVYYKITAYFGDGQSETVTKYKY